MWMAGYGARTNAATSKLQDLFAKALVLENPAGQRLALVTTDLVGMRVVLTKAVANELHRKHGLAREQIMFTSSHRHCGPLLDGDYYIYPATGLAPEEEEKPRRNTERPCGQLVQVVGQKLAAVAPMGGSVLSNGRQTALVHRRRFLTRSTTGIIVICMKVSKKTDYALRVLFTLVEHHGGGPIPIRELARRNDVPKRFLEQIMLDLKAQGWVDSVAGVRGGYVLTKSPDRIMMGEVVRHFDGILAPIECVSFTGYKRCSQEPVCRFRRVFLDARNYVANLMNRATLADVAKGKPVLGQEVFSPSFIGGEGI
jgi:Rrf2 family protein